MLSHWLAFSPDSPPQQVLCKILFIESLMVTLAIFGTAALGYPPDLHFREEGFITYVSCLQLLIATVISGKIFNFIRNSHNRQLKNSQTFWLVISLGLFFLALDDAFEIHEELDFLLHEIFNITQTTITDLLDDLIVGMYALIFLIYVAWQWKTIQLFKSAFIFFQVGCILTAIMIILDVASHNSYIASLVTADPTKKQLFIQWLGALEDGAKIFAEGLFIVGIYKCRQIAKSLSNKQ